MKLSRAVKDRGIGVIRIVLGGLLLYHGIEIFNSQTMEIYLGWDLFKGVTGPFMAYLGKALELISGVMFILGFRTRLASLITVGTFLYITFIIEAGKFWYDNQHPFLFVLLGAMFFFTGPGSWSITKSQDAI